MNFELAKCDYCGERAVLYDAEPFDKAKLCGECLDYLKELFEDEIHRDNKSE